MKKVGKKLQTSCKNMKFQKLPSGPPDSADRSVLACDLDRCVSKLMRFHQKHKYAETT